MGLLIHHIGHVCSALLSRLMGALFQTEIMNNCCDFYRNLLFKSGLTGFLFLFIIIIFLSHQKYC